MWQRNTRTQKTTAAAWGYCIIILTYTFFITTMYAILISKLMPDTGKYLRTLCQILDILNYRACVLLVKIVKLSKNCSENHSCDLNT